MSIREIVNSSGKFPGKKSGELKVDIDSSERAIFPLRVDAESGNWYAVDGNTAYEAPTKKELTEHMTKIAKAARVREWSRYIVVQYDAQIKHPTRSWTSDHRGIGDDRPEPDEDGYLIPCYGLRLRVEVYDFTQPFVTPGDTRTRRKMRKVWIDRRGEGTDSESWSGEALPYGAIPYTRARYEYFLDVQRGLAAADRRIVALLTGEPEEIGKRVDDAKSHDNITTGGSISQLLGGR